MKRPNKERAIRRVTAAIEMLDDAAENLPIDSGVRKRIILRRQDLEDLVGDMGQDRALDSSLVRILAPTINQHPDYERAKNICPKCHSQSTRQHNTAAREYEVLLECDDCGEVFDLKRAAEVEIGVAQ